MKCLPNASIYFQCSVQHRMWRLEKSQIYLHECIWQTLQSRATFTTFKHIRIEPLTLVLLISCLSLNDEVLQVKWWNRTALHMPSHRFNSSVGFFLSVAFDSLTGGSETLMLLTSRSSYLQTIWSLINWLWFADLHDFCLIGGAAAVYWLTGE